MADLNLRFLTRLQTARNSQESGHPTQAEDNAFLAVGICKLYYGNDTNPTDLNTALYRQLP